MKPLSLPVTAHSPLAIRSDHAEGGAATAHTIPGATLLGSLAAAHRILRPRQESEFASFFLNEQIFFPYLYPALFKDQALSDADSPVLPFPKTAQTCKRFPGFRLWPGEDADEERHGIRDTLLDWAVFSLLDLEEKNKPAIPILLKPLEEHVKCACQQVMDHENGYYRCDDIDPQLRAKAQVHTRLQTRTGINREWGVVEERILYNREVFDEDMRFWGAVMLPDALSDAFVAFLNEANKEQLIRIGTGRTRGMGNVDVNVHSISREDMTLFEERLKNFNTTLTKLANEAHVRKEHLSPFYFVLTLSTPTILCDPFLRYYNTIDSKTFATLLGYATNPFRRIYQAVGMQRITGWNELWGTPRSNDYALETGSTFLFACSHELDAHLLQALYQLEEAGIGRRRAEGFGRIRISDPFHLERKQV